VKDYILKEMRMKDTGHSLYFLNSNSNIDDESKVSVYMHVGAV
jgi:hypothetical protein